MSICSRYVDLLQFSTSEINVQPFCYHKDSPYIVLNNAPFDLQPKDFTFGAWNINGLKGYQKHSHVQYLCETITSDLFLITETHLNLRTHHSMTYRAIDTTFNVVLGPHDELPVAFHVTFEKI